MAGHKHRHMELVKNPKVRDWYKDNTESTAKNYVRTLGRFCEKTKTKPLSLLKMSGQALVDIWRDYAGTMQDKHGLRPAGATAKKALVSWLTFNGREQQAFAMSKRAKTGGSSTPRREFSSLPTQAKLAAALNVAKPKVQAEMAFMAFAGQRIEVMGMREKDDGLRLSDFPEAELRDGQFQFRKEPTYFRVRSEISKTREWYFAFLGPEGCRLVANYINTRLGAGEHVTMNSPVIAPDAVRRRGQSKVGNRVDFIHPNNIGDAIRACLRNVGIKVRPYDLRHYFSQNSELAQGLNTDWKEFWMGHVKSVKQKYSLRDPTQLVEPMRENYRKMLPYIETDQAAPKNLPSRGDVLRTLLAATGQFTDEQLAELSEEQVVIEGKALMDSLQRAEKRAQDQPKEMAQATPQRERKVLSEAEAEPLIVEGWNVVATLPSGKVVLERAQ